MKSIEDQIRAKKAEIKEANRALSKLQDELKKKSEPQWYKVGAFGDASRQYTHDAPTIDPNAVFVTVNSNKPIDCSRIKAAIESLSDKPSEHESYVDWSKMTARLPWGYPNYVFVGKNGTVWAMRSYPKRDDREDSGFCTAVPLWDVRSEWPNAIIGPLPAWDKSLIHRPGAKE